MKYTDLFDINQFMKFRSEIEKYNNFQYYNRSTAILKSSIKCFPAHPGLHYLLALTYFNCKEYVKATENFKKGMKLDELKNEYLGLISCCFFMMNDLENSYNYAWKAYEIDNNDVDAIVTLGRIEFLRNNFEESLSYAVIAVEIDNNNFNAVRLLSKIYISMGLDEKDTLNILYRVRSLGNDEDLTLDIIKILFLLQDYTSCLKECKNTIINHETGYVIENSTRIVKKIHEKFMTTNSSGSKESAVASNKEADDQDKKIEDKHKDIIKPISNNLFGNSTLDSIDKIIKYIEANPHNVEESPANRDESEKENIKNEINEAITGNKKSSGKSKTAEKIKEDFHKTLSLEEALNKLNSLTGLESVKKEVNKIVKYIKYEKNRNKILGLSNESIKSYHFAFLGNPGTGKTTVARLIGDIFYYLGILEKGQLVEVDRSDIVGKFIGETAKLTKKAINKAMGGILFIDEAYTLAKGGQDSNDYGKEAIEILLKAMEDNRGSFTVILAGYTKEMNNLMKLNPGLKSRINLEVNFEDYTDEELLDIGMNMAKEEKYEINEDGQKAFLEKLNIEKVDENFANARCARNIIEDAIREKAFRIGDDEVAVEELTTLSSEDFCVDLSFTAKENSEYYLNELDKLIGLENVKDVVKGILNTLEFNHKKKEMGIKTEDISLNMIFTGNPGTGKTTVARLIGKILKNMGILKKGHMIEVTRADLVGQYVGQTAIKTEEKIKEAYGGILFIDEAYSLNSGGQNDFGKEAIATLIKEMED
ncbi:MAG TPA: stage V sporulation protein K, partial [Clostridium sp.]|nr:stage V sporulation protein K [Clostridium sp.]